MLLSLQVFLITYTFISCYKLERDKEDVYDDDSDDEKMEKAPIIPVHKSIKGKDREEIPTWNQYGPNFISGYGVSSLNNPE